MMNVQEKIKQTCLKKYGMEYSIRYPSIQEKICQTFFERYGVTCTLDAENVGVEHPLSNSVIQEKIRQTNIVKYGTIYPMQNADIAEKSSKNAYKLKSFVLPSGKQIKLQGYEPRALVELLKVCSEDDVVSSRKEVPEIWYFDKDGKKHRHFVDFYIKSINWCIEVKSTWTYEINKEKVLAKRLAAINGGLNYTILIFEEHDLQEII